MKKIFNIILVILVLAMLFTAYKYTIIRKGTSFYFMKKNPATFQEIYVDITDWTLQDYAKHPKISAFLVASGIKGTSIKIKDKLKLNIMDKIEKQKEEMEKAIDKEE